MTKYINWYIFSAVNYYCLGIFVGHKIPVLGKWYPIIGQLLAYHSFICFVLMVIGFLGFVLSLKQGYLKYQFRLFGWIVIATLLVSMQGWLMVHNIYEGMIWYIIPSLLIICNDIFAYIVGYFFGKHQLIALSPKKTW
jgi:CDP-diglyceride synthetase